MSWTYKKRLEAMRKDLPYTPKHYKLAARVLTNLGEELRSRGIACQDDASWPFHITYLNLDGVGPRVSLYCGGFDERIDVAPLTKKGDCDERFGERGFMTITGAANYVIRKWG